MKKADQDRANAASDEDERRAELVILDPAWKDGARVASEGGFDLTRVELRGSGTTALTLSAPDLPEPLVIERFRNELSASSGPARETVVRSRGIWRHGGRPTLLLDDPGLEHGSALVGDVTLPTFLRVALGLARSVADVHRRAIVHRDLRPFNLFADRASGRVKLAGFGLSARAVRTRPAPGGLSQIVGTFGYVAPEQTGRMNRPVDARSDLYSLGVTLFQLLTGVLPYHATSPIEWMHCHIAKAPTPLGEIRPDVPPVIAEIVAKLLAKSPDERYQTAHGLAADLGRCLTDAGRENDSAECALRIPGFELAQHDVPERIVSPTRLYGRDAEVARLHAVADRVAETGKMALVTVAGEPGVGKSAVVQELARRGEGSFAMGKEEQLRGRAPYASLVQALTDVVHEVLSRSDAELEAWRDALLVELGGERRIVCDVVPALEAIVGTAPPTPKLAPHSARNRLHGALSRLLAAFARLSKLLVLFLDDLQWLDGGTFDLLEEVVLKPPAARLVLVCAYRSDAVAGEPRLRSWLGRMRAEAPDMVELHLAPLAHRSIHGIVSETLRVTREPIEPFVDVVVHKTGGNPFHVMQLLHSLVDAGSLGFDPELRTWTWDLSEVRRQPPTGNAIGLLIARMESLPATTRSILSLLACLGDAAGPAALAELAEETEDEIRLALSEAALFELIAQSGREFAFAHDRVQEAAYARLDEPRRMEVHAKVGRKMLARWRERGEAGDEIFEIVHHLRRALAIGAPVDVRLELASLELVAGRRARATSAFPSALDHFTAGDELLDGPGMDQRSRDGAASVSLSFHRAEAEWLVGDLDAASRRLEKLAPRAVSARDIGAIAAVRVQIHSVRGELETALNLGLEYLERVGRPLPRDPSDAILHEEFQAIHVARGRRTFAELVDSPPAAAEHSQTLEVLFAMQMSALYSNQGNLHCLIGCRMVRLSLELGIVESSPQGFVLLAMVCAPRFGDYEVALELGTLGLDLVRRHGIDRCRAPVILGFGCVVAHWARPYRSCVPYIREGIAAALQLGDPPCAAAGFQLISNFLAAGRPLPEVENEANEQLVLARRVDALPSVSLLVDQLVLVRTLREVSSGFPRLSVGERVEGTYEDDLAKRPGIPLVTCWYWIRKLIVRVLGGDFAAAVAAAEAAAPLLWVSTSNVDNGEHTFYAAIAHAGCVDAELEARDTHLAEARRHLHQLDAWATHCPANFAARRELVRAELARLDLRESDARRGYDKAMDLARQEGFAQVEGLAAELAGRFHEQLSFPVIAGAYFKLAHAAYGRWGAAAKVAQLERSYPDVFDPERLAGPAALRSATTSGAGVRPGMPLPHELAALDVSTVVRISQAVGGEIDLERLVETLMTIAAQEAGADRCLLLLVRHDGLHIVSEAESTRHGVLVVARRAPLTAADAPMAVINYARRTRTTVIVDDATKPGRYSADDYFRDRAPRSLLCLPLVKQSQLVGLLLLENRVAPGAFTPARCAMLELVARLSAMALDNAKLFDELKQAKVYMGQGEALGQTGTFSWRPDAGEMFWSDEMHRIFELEGHPSLPLMRSRIHRDDLAGFDAVLRLQPVSERSLDCRVAAPSGVTRSVVIKVVQRGESGPTCEVVGAVRDVTEIRHAEDRLQWTKAVLEERARAANLGEMAAAIAHEVNQPLLGIGLNASACLRWLQNVEHLGEARAAGERIVRDAKRAASVIERLRALFGGGEPEHVRIDINDVVGEVVPIARLQADRSTVSMRLDLARSLAPVAGDRVQLQQLMLNLLTNAFEAVSEIGDRPREVTIRTRPDGDRVRIEVQDNGPGVGAADVERIFSPFETSKKNGMGMGLAICRTIVQSHGGVMSVARGEGAGATFAVQLPVVA